MQSAPRSLRTSTTRTAVSSSRWGLKRKMPSATLNSESVSISSLVYSPTKRLAVPQPAVRTARSYTNVRTDAASSRMSRIALKLSITTMAGSSFSTRATIASRTSAPSRPRTTEPRSAKTSLLPINCSSKKENCCMYWTSFRAGSERVVRYRPLLPCRARLKSICSANNVFPEPGPPAIMLRDLTGSPPPRIRSKAALPVERRSKVGWLIDLAPAPERGDEAAGTARGAGRRRCRSARRGWAGARRRARAAQAASPRTALSRRAARNSRTGAPHAGRRARQALGCGLRHAAPRASAAWPPRRSRGRPRGLPRAPRTGRRQNRRLQQRRSPGSRRSERRLHSLHLPRRNCRGRGRTENSRRSRGPIRACCDIAYRSQQPVDIDGFGEMLLESGSDGAPPVLVACEGGQGDGGHLRSRHGVELPQRADEAVPVLAGHRYVAKDELRMDLGERAPCLLRGRDCADLRPGVPEDLLDGAAGRLIVVDNEDRQSLQSRQVGPAPVAGEYCRPSDHLVLDGDEREGYLEGRSLPLAFARRGHRAPVRLDDVPDDRETETEAAVVPRRSAVFLGEPVEDVGQESGIDSGAGVAHLDDGVPAGAADGERHAPSHGSELEGIRQEVPQDLLESRSISRNQTDRPIDVGVDDDRLPLRLRKDGLDRRVSAPADVDGLHLHLELPGHDAGAIEKIVDELRLRLDGSLDRFGAAFDPVLVQLPAAHHLSVHEHGPEGGTQLVRESGEELILGEVRPLRFVLRGAGLGQERSAFRLAVFALGDVLDGEEDHGGSDERLHRPRRQAEPPLPAAEVELDFVPLEARLRCEGALQHRAELRDVVPGSALPFKERLALRALRHYPEGDIEGLVRGKDAQVPVEDHQRDLHRFHDSGSVVPRP